MAVAGPPPATQHRALPDSHRLRLGWRAPPVLRAPPALGAPPYREQHSPNHTPDRGNGLAPKRRTLCDTTHNEPSFLFSQFDSLSNRPDRHQIVGLETEHFFNVSPRVGHAVLCLNLTGDVLD